MTGVDKALLFTPRLPEAEVELPGIGVIRVRGLNRGEAMMVQEAKGTEATERRIISLGMLDPVLTEDEVKRWQRAAPAGEIEPVSRKIAELSGMLEDSAKAAYKSDGGEPGPGVRAVPGGGVGDDGGPTPDGDV